MNESEYSRYENKHDIDENRLWEYYIVGQALPETVE